MGHSTTVYGAVAEYSEEGFIEHPQWGQFRRIGSVALRGRRRYIAHPASNPHPAEPTSAASDTPYRVISSVMPPCSGDHVAASTTKMAAMAARTATTIPETMETTTRP